jgi:hypothetical protein
MDQWDIEGLAFQTLRERNITDARAKDAAEFAGLQFACMQGIAAMRGASTIFGAYSFDNNDAAAYLAGWISTHRR